MKAISFGVPGGMMPEGLADYARRSYGQDLTVDQAAVFRETMITTTYPEVGRWLESDQPSVMARAMNTVREAVIRAFGDGPILGAARRIVGGRPYTRAGRYYDDAFVGDIWRRLAAVNRNPDLVTMITQQDTETLPKRIFWQPVKTMTGRIRARAAYTQSRNLPFQALAADGCKLGLWRLYRRGFKIVGFVHDEVVIELPGNRAEQQAKQIDRLLCTAMEELTPGVPCACEWSVGREWAKP